MTLYILKTQGRVRCLRDPWKSRVRIWIVTVLPLSQVEWMWVLMRKIYSPPLGILLVNWWEYIQGSICWDDIILVWNGLMVNEILQSRAVRLCARGTEHLQCGCLQLLGLPSWAVEGNWYFWAAVDLLKLASDRSGEWGWKSAFALSLLTMEAVTTGLSETKHLPCDSDQLTAQNFALEQATFHEAKRSYFQTASPSWQISDLVLEKLLNLAWEDF